MMLAIHGVAGGWDEVAIAVTAFVVLWVAVKLAGRKPADDDDEEDEEEGKTDGDGSPVEAAAKHRDPASPAAPLG